MQKTCTSRDSLQRSHFVKKLALLLVFTPCLLQEGFGADQLSISSFSTILTEIAQTVGGDRVQVWAHVKPGVDPHEFEPQPEDLKRIAASHLVLLSAKHMEGFVSKLEEATGTIGKLLKVGNQFPSLKMPAEEGSGLVEDPHWWHSVANARRATKIVCEALTKISPGDQATFSANAEAYLARLTELENWVKTKVAELPRNRRTLVTSHDAFQYFAKEYGFTIYAVEGLSSTDQPSSKSVVELIRSIKKHGVKAIFAEKLESPKVLAEITRETGAKLGGELYADGLAAEGPAATYEGMIKHNVATIVDALK